MPPLKTIPLMPLKQGIIALFQVIGFCAVYYVFLCYHKYLHILEEVNTRKYITSCNKLKQNYGFELSRAIYPQNGPYWTMFEIPKYKSIVLKMIHLSDLNVT